MGKVIVLTGVSKGLGRALAKEFAKSGNQLIGCARSASAIESLQQKIGAPHKLSSVDLTIDSEVENWVADVLQTVGPPDLLINNAAAINTNAPLWEVPAEEFSRVIDVNVTAVYRLIRYFLPSMIARSSGVIVNLSSGWGRSVSADVAPYCASKWAIEGLTRALAEDLPPGLAAIPMNPGVINTDMLQSCFGDSASQYPDAETWARTAAPYLLELGVEQNGQPVTAPG